ncbi:hypothetical protein [Vibrio anguillarum]|uniref:hypothetical protein n=1 Tax=Vibrio anguillarum TaxID=55601 RepID=UPI0018FE0F3B
MILIKHNARLRGSQRYYQLTAYHRNHTKSTHSKNAARWLSLLKRLLCAIFAHKALYWLLNKHQVFGKIKLYKWTGELMKTTAYVLDTRTNTYLIDHHNHLRVDIHEALDIRDNPMRYRDPVYKYRKYMTRNPNPDNRVELIPRNGKSPHFAFTKSSTTTGDRSYDETYSHEIAVDVLSSMKEMTIVTRGQTFNFKFASVYREPKLVLPNGKIFYPDILCVFDKAHYPDEYERWGGKLVIEVTNTHECEDEKKIEFELCNIPIFEFTITDSRKYPPERDSKRFDSIIERKKHKERLENWLQESVCADLIIDPISTQKHDTILKTLKSEMKELLMIDMHNKLLIQDLESKFKETEQQKVSLIKARQIKNEEHERLQDKISKLEFSKSQYESTLLNYKSNFENFQNSAHQRIFESVLNSV